LASDWGAPFAAFADNQGNRRKVGRAEKWQPATQVGTRENSFVWPVIRFPFRQAGRVVSSLIRTTAFHRRTELKPKKLKDLYKKSTVQYLPYQRGNIIGSTVH